ncbi:Spherulation-specific family 4-domain-containing protein, partial [Leptodontidium sp. 2 PMI_412]
MNDAGGDTTIPSGDIQIAIASYTNPLGDAPAWARLISYPSNKLSILVANVLNGPDYVVDEGWRNVIQQATNSGKTVIGYVRTGYLGVSSQQFKTRLGSGDLADWASQIEQDVDKWFELYPGGIGGIFFDEGWPECGPNNVYSDLYAYINAYTKRKHPGAYTLLNPGSPMAQCYEDTMDTLLTFESSYETYTSSAFTPNDWTPKDPRKIWHIVYRVPESKVSEVVALAAKRGVGYLEMTDDDNPNPYDNVPVEAYMQSAMSAVAGGTVLKGTAAALGGSYVAGLPNDAAILITDYTSAILTWSPVANALGYAVYQDGNLIMELPPTLTRATVGMLKPGAYGIKLEVRTLLSSGGGGESKLLNVNTRQLPSGESITNVIYRIDGSNVIYQADVLVPFAFVRLFVGGPHKAVGGSSGWPIDGGMSIPDIDEDELPHAQYKLVNYMVEGNDFYAGFYKYSGAYVDGGTANADWTWTPQGTSKLTQSGYTYTWVVPLGGTDALPEDYVVQGQGYAPIQNTIGGYFRSYKCGEPCDDNPDYDCKGSSLCSTPNFLKWCDIAVNNLIRTDDLTYGTS